MERLNPRELQQIQFPGCPGWSVWAHLCVDEGDRDVSVVGDHRQPVPELGEAQHHVGVAWGGGDLAMAGRFLIWQTIPTKNYF